jgi:hypothetical protein
MSRRQPRHIGPASFREPRTNAAQRLIIKYLDSFPRCSASNHRTLAAPIGRTPIFIPTNPRMAGPKLTLYVDTVSPFAYEAYYILRVGARRASPIRRGHSW